MLQPKVLFGMALVMALVASGCGKKSDPTTAAGNNSSGGGSGSSAPVKLAKDDGFPLPEQPWVAECEPGIHGGRLIFATFGDPKTFNPITDNESSSRDINRLFFASLADSDWITQGVLPGLAYEWKVDSDQKTWTYKLRKNLKWSDGKPLTADDVVFTYNDILYNPKIANPSADLLKVDGKAFEVTKVDDYTIKVVTPDIYAPFEEYFSSIPILPKHILEATVKEGKFESAYGINTPPDQFVVNGPYKLKSFKAGELTLLERNPYYGKTDKQGQRLPYIDQVVHTVVPDQNAVSLRFLAGESHLQEIIRPDEVNRFKEEANKGKFKFIELGIGPEKSFIWFNLNNRSHPETGKPYVEPHKLKWFREVKFRQAIAHAIDRESIIRSVLAGRGEVHFGFISPANKKWVNVNVPKYPTDLTKARALLKEIGIEDRNGNGIMEDSSGKEIEFRLTTNSGNNARERISVLILEDLKRLGIKVQFQPVSFNSLVDRIDVSYDYDCMYLGLGGGGLDPAASMNVLMSSGFTHFWSPKQTSPSFEWEAKIDDLMNRQVKTVDFVERKKLFDEVQVIMGEQVPFIYLAAPYNYSAVHPDLANLRPTVLSSYRLTWNLEELYFLKR